MKKKRCPKCGCEDLSAFAICRSNPGGLQTQCKACHNAIKRAFRARKKNPPPPIKRFCRYEFCAREYTPDKCNNNKQAYCSRLCAQREWIRNNRAWYNKRASLYYWKRKEAA